MSIDYNRWKENQIKLGRWPRKETAMRYKIEVACPECKRTSEIHHETATPLVSCGECLFDRLEVVHMNVVRVRIVSE